VNKLPIESITHNFLETGHTQNENDAVHAVIECSARNAVIYTPEQWSAIVRTARPSKPYQVKDMQPSNFFNFKQVAKHQKL
jgi:hypothetical protein